MFSFNRKVSSTVFSLSAIPLFIAILIAMGCSGFSSHMSNTSSNSTSVPSAGSGSGTFGEVPGKSDENTPPEFKAFIVPDSVVIPLNGPKNLLIIWRPFDNNEGCDALKFKLSAPEGWNFSLQIDDTDVRGPVTPNQLTTLGMNCFTKKGVPSDIQIKATIPNGHVTYPKEEPVTIELTLQDSDGATATQSATVLVKATKPDDPVPPPSIDVTGYAFYYPSVDPQNTISSPHINALIELNLAYSNTTYIKFYLTTRDDESNIASLPSLGEGAPTAKFVTQPFNPPQAYVDTPVHILIDASNTGTTHTYVHFKPNGSNFTIAGDHTPPTVTLDQDPVTIKSGTGCKDRTDPKLQPFYIGETLYLHFTISDNIWPKSALRSTVSLRQNTNPLAYLAQNLADADGDITLDNFSLATTSLQNADNLALFVSDPSGNSSDPTTNSALRLPITIACNPKAPTASISILQRIPKTGPAENIVLDSTITPGDQLKLTDTATDECTAASTLNHYPRLTDTGGVMLREFAKNPTPNFTSATIKLYAQTSPTLTNPAVNYPSLVNRGQMQVSVKNLCGKETALTSPAFNINLNAPAPTVSFTEAGYFDHLKTFLTYRTGNFTFAYATCTDTYSQNSDVRLTRLEFIPREAVTLPAFFTQAYNPGGSGSYTCNNTPSFSLQTSSFPFGTNPGVTQVTGRFRATYENAAGKTTTLDVPSDPGKWIIVKRDLSNPQIDTLNCPSARKDIQINQIGNEPEFNFDWTVSDADTTPKVTKIEILDITAPNSIANPAHSATLFNKTYATSDNPSNFTWNSLTNPGSNWQFLQWYPAPALSSDKNLTMRLTITDEAGNTSTRTCASAFKVGPPSDSVPPVAAITDIAVKKNGKLLNGSEFTIKYTVVDSAAAGQTQSLPEYCSYKLSYSTDGGASYVTPPIQNWAWGAGTHESKLTLPAGFTISGDTRAIRLKVEGTDGAWPRNTAETTSDADVEDDRSAPTVTLMSPDPSSAFVMNTLSNKVFFQLNDDSFTDDRVAAANKKVYYTASYLLDGVETQIPVNAPNNYRTSTATFPITFDIPDQTLPTDGKITIKIVPTDNSRKQNTPTPSPTFPFNVKYDDIAPTIVLDSSGCATLISGSLCTFRVTIADNLSAANTLKYRIAYSLDGTNYSWLNSSFASSFKTYGSSGMPAVETFNTGRLPANVQSNVYLRIEAKDTSRVSDGLGGTGNLKVLDVTLNTTHDTIAPTVILNAPFDINSPLAQALTAGTSTTFSLTMCDGNDDGVCNSADNITPQGEIQYRIRYSLNGGDYIPFAPFAAGFIYYPSSGDFVTHSLLIPAEAFDKIRVEIEARDGADPFNPRIATYDFYVSNRSVQAAGFASINYFSPLNRNAQVLFDFNCDGHKTLLDLSQLQDGILVKNRDYSTNPICGRDLANLPAADGIMYPGAPGHENFMIWLDTDLDGAVDTGELRSPLAQNPYNYNKSIVWIKYFVDGRLDILWLAQ